MFKPWQNAGTVIVTPPKSNRKTKRDDDEDLDKDHHRIGNFLARLTHSRAITTRYAKRVSTFCSAVSRVASYYGAMDDTP